VKVWVLSEHRGWASDRDYDEHYSEAGVWLVTSRLEDAEDFARGLIEKPFADDPPPTSWFLDVTEMTVGVPLTGREARIVINKRGDRADHPGSLDVRLTHD
jgi:hypothetical protein